MSKKSTPPIKSGITLAHMEPGWKFTYTDVPPPEVAPPSTPRSDSRKNRVGLMDREGKRPVGEYSQEDREALVSLGKELRANKELQLAEIGQVREYASKPKNKLSRNL